MSGITHYHACRDCDRDIECVTNDDGSCPWEGGNSGCVCEAETHE